MDWFLYDNDLRHERVNKHYEDSNVGFMIVHQIPVNPQFLLSKLCWPLHYISSYKKFAYKIVLSEILTFLRLQIHFEFNEKWMDVLWSCKRNKYMLIDFVLYSS